MKNLKIIKSNLCKVVLLGISNVSVFYIYYIS